MASNPLESLFDDPRLKLLGNAFNGEQLFLVGGTIRDALLNRPTADLDLASPLLPEELRSKAQAAGFSVYPTGLKHQTVTLKILPELPPVEVTSFRGSGMQPEGGVVKGADIFEDLSYRDFTINALAYELQSGEFLDPHDGTKDIENRLLRAVGEPKTRFDEDPLRAFRMVRLACELEFEIEPATLAAAQLERDSVEAISIERIREEFSKTLLSPQAKRGLSLLSDLGLLAVFLPEVDRFRGFEQNSFHQYDLFEHTLEVVEGVSPDLTVRLAALLHDVGKPDTVDISPRTGERCFYRHESVGAQLTCSILERLRYSQSLRDDVARLVRTHMRPLSLQAGGMRRLIRDTEDLLPLWRELVESDARATKYPIDALENALRTFDSKMETVLEGPAVSPLKNLAVNGRDLLELGFEEGPIIGQILRALHEKVLDEPELNDRETLLGFAQTMYAVSRDSQLTDS